MLDTKAADEAPKQSEADHRVSNVERRQLVLKLYTTPAIRRIVVYVIPFSHRLFHFNPDLHYEIWDVKVFWISVTSDGEKMK